MTLLDTDTISLVLAGQERVLSRLQQARDELAITVITKVEILRGRYDFLLKASDGTQLLRAQSWLATIEQELDRWNIVGVNAAAAAEFDRLRQIRNVKRIGRADLLIASIALAQRATLVTRNLRHFRENSGLNLENWAD
jgi:tRNA(fMet)-specific endonuclease VapC